MPLHDSCRRLLLFLFALTLRQSVGADLDYSTITPSPGWFSAPGPFDVGSDTTTWHDEARRRSIPIKLYHPSDAGEKRHPVIVFSHGLGGSREGCAYLGRMWASHGFLSVHPQHHGSDEDVWRRKLRPLQALKSSFEDPDTLIARVLDLQFVLDSLEEHVANETPLGKMADMDRIGVAGHAFGALTALAMAGQRVPALDPVATLPDSRVKAILALSSPVLFDGHDYQETYERIRIPTLHMTGTEDDSPIGPTRAVHRRIPFENMGGADQFLITFSEADHLTFSGHLRDRATRNDAFFQTKIGAVSTAFWVAYLCGETRTRAWFTEKGLRMTVGEAGHVEHKTPAGREERSEGPD